jgi:hypothetical protein
MKKRRSILLGQGNICTHYECEGLYYLDRDLLDVYRRVIRCGDCGHIKDFDWETDAKTARELRQEGIAYSFSGDDGACKYDQLDSQYNWMEMENYMRDYFSRQFPSFRSVDKWRDYSSGKVVLESTFFHVVVMDNGWSAAWCLLERADVDDDGSNRPLMRRHYRTYLEAIKNALISQWGEAIGYGGAWTHGRVYRRIEMA